MIETLRFLGVVFLVACSSRSTTTHNAPPEVARTRDASAMTLADAAMDAGGSAAATATDAYEACRQDDQASCDALAAACDGGGVSAACVKLGNVYRLAIAAKQDDVKARAWFARACTLPKGPFDGCVELAEIDCRVGDTKTTGAAVSTLDQACDGKSAKSCAFAGLLHAEGLCDVPYNAGSWSLGVAYYERACELGHLGGCTHLGLLVRAGHGVRKDEARGKKLLDDACKRGDTVACEYAKE